MSEDDFYIKDYEIKVRFFTDQLSRMWQRFNYFLVLETALFGGKIYTEKDLKLQIGFVVLGIFVSVFWYIMGSEDRYLVRVYRTSIEDAFKSIRYTLKKIKENKEQENNTIPEHYYSAGEIVSYKDRLKAEDSKKKNWFNKIFNGWRKEEISTTHLAAIIPFLITLVWLGMLLWHLIKPEGTL